MDISKEWKHMLQCEADDLQDLAQNSVTLKFHPTIAETLLNISEKLKHLALDRSKEICLKSNNDRLCKIFKDEAEILALVAQQKSGWEENYVEDEMVDLLFVISNCFEEIFENHIGIHILRSIEPRNVIFTSPFQEMLKDKYFFIKGLAKRYKEKSSKNSITIAFFLRKYSKIIRRQISHFGGFLSELKESEESNVRTTLNSPCNFEKNPSSSLTKRSSRCSVDSSRIIEEYYDSRTSTSSTCRSSNYLDESFHTTDTDDTRNSIFSNHRMSFRRGSTFLERIEQINQKNQINDSCIVCCVNAMDDRSPTLCLCSKKISFLRK